MSREEFEEKLKQLREIGEGKFPRDSAVDKQLAKVDRATEAVDKMASRIENKQGATGPSGLVAPIVAPIVTAATGANGTVTSASPASGPATV